MWNVVLPDERTTDLALSASGISTDSLSITTCALRSRTPESRDQLLVPK